MRHNCSQILLIKILCSLIITILGCNPSASSPSAINLRLATTTTTYDSGLIDKLLPPFQSENNVRVDVIAVGTGKALKLAQSGDVDVVMVHSRSAEDAFMSAGHGARREDVMQNYFLLVGPKEDPAGINGLPVAAALQKIAEKNCRFVSRGDESGTHQREIDLWNKQGARPEWSYYVETGQGMGATLTIADQMAGYTLTDEGTFYRYVSQLDLVAFSKPTEELINAYGIILVNSKKSQLQETLANQFVDYIISPKAQKLIADYQISGRSLFAPAHLPSVE